MSERTEKKPFLELGIEEKTETLSGSIKSYRERVMTVRTIECPLLKRLSSFPNSGLLPPFTFQGTTSMLIVLRKGVKPLSKCFISQKVRKNLAEFAPKDCALLFL